MDIYLQEKRVKLDPTQALGKGGEADVYAWGPDRALKVFKTPDHPDLHGQPAEQELARQRLALHQRKLPAFPTGLPDRVVAPLELATDRGGRHIVGYAMRKVAPAEPLLRFADVAARRRGLTSAHAVSVLADLSSTVDALHAAGIVIGDFSDLNVLVQAERAYLIDADSFQFANFPCPLFTARFVDPRLCALEGGELSLTHPHDQASDWYAFAVMLMQSLLCVGPFGGIYRPAPGQARLSPGERALKRVSVFRSEVQYPKPARPLASLPDPLVDWFFKTFEGDRRGPPPQALLNSLAWTRCAGCGLEHARLSCPVCVPHAQAPSVPVVRVRGEVTAKTLFRTSGAILEAASGQAGLRWLYDENDRLHREDGSVVLDRRPPAETRFGLQGARTLVARGGALEVHRPGQPIGRLQLDWRPDGPSFAANEAHHYWSEGGQLFRDGALGPVRLGDVLQGQTHLWAGPRFGLGLYRAGGLSVGFLFDAEQPGIRDSLALPRLRGALVRTACTFSDRCAWLFLALRDAGKTRHLAIAIGAQGAVLATAEAEEGDGGWLGTLGGHCAVGEQLFAPTHAGLARVEVRGGQLVVAREFPDAEPFVDESTQLLLEPRGLCAVSEREISLLRMS